jgi:NADH:ubiquinone oxidoreductase subunit 6 (subunit J)
VIALFGFLGITKGLFTDFGNFITGSVEMKIPIMSVAGFIPTLESLTYVGHAFYVRYADVLILNSLVLTVALFGALVLAHTK